MNQIDPSQNKAVRDARNERLAFGIGRENSRRVPSRLSQNKIEEHDYVADMHRRAEVAKARELQQKQQRIQSQIENQRKERLEHARLAEDEDLDDNLDGFGNSIRNKYREEVDDLRKKYHDAKKLGGQAKTLVKSATPWGFFSLLSEINILTDWTYFAALIVAMFKDLLDFIGVGSLPAIGTVVTFCASIFIMFMLILGNMMHKEHDRTIFQSYILKRWGILLVVTVIELFFGANFLPVETIGVLLIWAFALAARKGRKMVIEEGEEDMVSEEEMV